MFNVRTIKIAFTTRDGTLKGGETISLASTKLKGLF
jgi:hypothetical protein